MRNRFYLSILLTVAISLSGCAGAKAKKAALQKKKKIEMAAELHFHQGVDSYVNSRYAEAIKEWKKTLELQPDHANALEYIKRAEQKQASIEKLKTADE